MLEYVAGAIIALVGVLFGGALTGLNKGNKKDGTS